MRKRLHVWISGRVQGVFFRAFVKNVIDQINLKSKDPVVGFVKNLTDGRVEAVFEGHAEDLKPALEMCYQGPPGSKVERIEEQWEAVQGEYQEFRIWYT